MRTSSVLLALPALGTAQQFPFLDPYLDQIKGFFSSASSTVSSSVSSAAPSSFSVPNPVASGAAKYADLKVERLTLGNHKSLFVPSSAGIEEWMTFVTGGNGTCFGMCGHAETAWNESVALMAASSKPPHLAMVDCDTQGPLCAAWALSPPAVLHFLIPQPLPDQSQPATAARSIHVNRTTVTAPEIAAIHLQETYKERPAYEGFWHPFNGPLADYGLQIPVGYTIWGFSKIPSWAFMIGVSFLSRSIMSRRMNTPPPSRLVVRLLEELQRRRGDKKQRRGVDSREVAGAAGEVADNAQISSTTFSMSASGEKL